MSISYDRIAPDYFLRWLTHGGCFDSLVRFAKDEPLLDLQFRGGGKAEPRITLYYGLTALLDVRGKRAPDEPDDPLFQVRPHKGRQATARLPEGLRVWQRASQLAAGWPEIEDYLEKLMAEMNRRWVHGEGAVPSSLKATRLISVIDREVVLCFSNDTERRRNKDEVVKKYRDVLSHASDERWWDPPGSFGNELDILGVDERGRVLLVELKQASATSGIAWAPAQVSVYCDLFARWVEQDPPGAARGLSGMLTQRRKLGLAGGGAWKIETPLRLVPVVGIGGDAPGTEAMRRLHLVQQALRRGRIGYEDLEVWEFGGVRRRSWRELASGAPRVV
jgi:hypothetical protein